MTTKVADDGGRGRRRGGGSLDRSPGGRRPTGSYEDDETYATDAESYDDDDTYDESRKGSAKRRRGRDRKPRSPASTADSPSEMTGGNSEYYDDDTPLVMIRHLAISADRSWFLAARCFRRLFAVERAELRRVARGGESREEFRADAPTKCIQVSSLINR